MDLKKELLKILKEKKGEGINLVSLYINYSAVAILGARDTLMGEGLIEEFYVNNRKKTRITPAGEKALAAM